jgi:uncharacterized repeat protein (TIGR01451 family)
MTTKPEALLLCLLLAAPLSAQPTPVGSELQINTYTTGFQFAPRVAMDPDGDFIVVWQSGTAATPGPDGDDAGIRGRRYISNGTALGSEFAVNTYTTSSQARPAVATDGLGNFIVVWQSGTFSVPGPDGDNAGIEGQRFHADGTPAGGEFQVNTYTTGYQGQPSVAADAAGGFVVAWDRIDSDFFNYEVVGRRFAADGNPVGDEFLVGSGTSPDVALQPGGFVVAWDESPLLFAGSAARRFAADGTPLGDFLDVGTFPETAGTVVSSDADGDFVVAWSNFYDSIVEARRFAADGSPLGERFLLHTTTGSHGSPDLASDAAGNFLAVWRRFSGGSSIRGQRISSNGTFLGGEFQVNTSPSPSAPAVASDPDGDLVVVWSGPEIHGQLFSPDESADVAISKDDGVDRVLPGAQVIYTVVAENLGPSFADPASVTDMLPSELACDWTSVAAGGASGNTNGSGDLDETLALPLNSSVTYTVTCDVAVDATGTLVNTATISSPLPDPVPGNNSAVDDDTRLRIADLSIALADSSDPVSDVALLVYTVLVDNGGPESAEDVRVTSLLPPDATLVQAAGAGWVCSGAGIVVCGRSVVGVGSAPPLTITVTTPAFEAVLSHHVVVSAVELDPDLGGNVASEPTSVAIGHVFADGFESGDVSRWSSVVGQ